MNKKRPLSTRSVATNWRPNKRLYLNVDISTNIILHIVTVGCAFESRMAHQKPRGIGVFLIISTFLAIFHHRYFVVLSGSFSLFSANINNFLATIWRPKYRWNALFSRLSTVSLATVATIALDSGHRVAIKHKKSRFQRPSSIRNVNPHWQDKRRLNRRF